MAVAYPYLWTSLTMLAASAAVVALLPAHRRGMLVSGILCAPFALASVMFVPEYWRPHRIACFLAGPEDLIFSFACGVLVWCTAVVLSPPRTMAFRPSRVFRVYGGACIVFVGGILVFRNLCGLRTMPSVLVAGLVLYGLLLPLRRDLLRFSLVAGFAYCVAYALFFGLVFAVCPDFARQWNWDNLWALSLLGVPLEEAAFALVFGACWPLAMAQAFDVRLAPETGARARGWMRCFDSIGYSSE
jgi:hypothetical protein